MTRADAVRNRQRVLAAARQAFATHGLGVPIDDIARAAGVGAGTIYRHFPTKEILYESILVEHVETLAGEARTLAVGDHPGVAFFTFLAGFATRGVGNRALADALAGAGIDVDGRLANSKAALFQAVHALMASAQRSGAVRADLTDAELFALLAGVHTIAENGNVPVARLLELLSDGLRTR